VRRVVPRADREALDDQQLLLRMNDDRDVGNALKLALAFAPAYRALPGFESTGAVTVSCFEVSDEVEAQILVRGSRWSWYGLATAGSLRALGCQLVGTDVYEGDDLLPLSDKHIDAVVCAYPAGVGDYAALDRGARARLRESLSARYAAVLRAFDPRRSVAEET
jgi:hypothetical protein